MSSQATGVGSEMRKTVASSRITGETNTPSQAASRSLGGRGSGGGGGGTNRSSGATSAGSGQRSELGRTWLRLRLLPVAS